MPAVKKAKVLRVTAPLVEVSLGTTRLRFAQGDVLPEGVSEESVEHLKSLGFVEDIDAPAATDSE